MLVAHQTPDALLAKGFAVFLQVFPPAWTPIAMTARGMEGAQFRAQDDIALRPGGEPATHHA